MAHNITQASHLVTISAASGKLISSPALPRDETTWQLFSPAGWPAKK
jgi:hypothetical protein